MASSISCAKKIQRNDRVFMNEISHFLFKKFKAVLITCLLNFNPPVPMRITSTSSMTDPSTNSTPDGSTVLIFGFISKFPVIIRDARFSFVIGWNLSKVTDVEKVNIFLRKDQNIKPQK